MPPKATLVYGARRFLRRLVVAALVAHAAFHTAAQPPSALPLNSERIEARFGSYGIEVLASDRRFRVSNLFSTDTATGRRTTRTFALVRYPDKVPDALVREHTAIVSGGSIGATLKASGWDVLKTNLWFGEIDSTPLLQELMALTQQKQLAVHVYALAAEQGEHTLTYAQIVEVHHPDYLNLAEVRRIYAQDGPGGGEAQVSALLAELRERIR